MENRLSHQLAETLALRLGPHASSDHLADVISSTCLEISEALDPVLGQTGVSALFQRSLNRTLKAHPWLAAMEQDMHAPVHVENLKFIFSQQSPETAALGGTEFLTSFCQLLSSLIGPSLTEQLLQPIWKSNRELSFASSAQHRTTST